jgi:hypothetical protein
METAPLNKGLRVKLAVLPALFASLCLVRAADQGPWPAAGIAAGPLRAACDVYITNYQSLYYCGSNYSSGSGTITAPWWGGFDYILSNNTVPGRCQGV